MTTPLPGHASRGSTSGQPLMAAFDLLGRRWTMRILWELKGKPLSFRALQSACGGLSPSLLNRRLKDLRISLLITAEAEGYVLTPLGQELMQSLDPLRDWSKSWANAFKSDDNMPKGD